VREKASTSDLWDLFTTGIRFGPDPALTSNLQCDWPGWWCHEEKERLLTELIREGDPKKRRALIARPALLERLAAALTRLRSSPGPCAGGRPS
jgi:hypothetical protein